MLNRRHANADLIHSCIYATSGGDEQIRSVSCTSQCHTIQGIVLSTFDISQCIFAKNLTQGDSWLARKVEIWGVFCKFIVGTKLQLSPCCIVFNIELYSTVIYQEFSTLRPRQNGRLFADNIFKCIFLNENVSISINISLKYVPKCPINNIPALVQIMAWCRPGYKPLPEPMLVGSLMHIWVTRPQWFDSITI